MSWVRRTPERQHGRSCVGTRERGKVLSEIVSEVKELAVRAAEQEDVQERLAVKAFLGAIPCPFVKKHK